jgi:hypothetical protein
MVKLYHFPGLGSLILSILQVDIYSYVDIWKVAIPRPVSHQRVIITFYRTFSAA